MVWMEIQARVEIERSDIDDLTDDLSEVLCGSDHGGNEACPRDWIVASRIVAAPTHGWMADLVGNCGIGLEDL